MARNLGALVLIHFIDARARVLSPTKHVGRATLAGRAWREWLELGKNAQLTVNFEFRVS